MSSNILLNTDPAEVRAGTDRNAERRGNRRNLASTYKKLRPSLVAMFQISKVRSASRGPRGSPRQERWETRQEEIELINIRTEVYKRM